MSDAKLSVTVAFSGNAIVTGLQALRQNTEQLRQSLAGVKLRQEFGNELLTLKAKFNEVSKSGNYTSETVKQVAKQVGELASRARAAGLNVGKLHSELKALRAQETALRIQHAGVGMRERGEAMRGEARGKLMDAAASGYALYKPFDVAARYEDVVKDIAITGDMTRKEEAELAKSIRGLAVRFNQEQHNVAEGMKRLVETGMSKQAAQAMTPLLAKTATATRTDMGDAARMSRTLELIEVQAKDMELAFNQAAKAGKLGSFELRDMAKWFPALGGFMKELGIKGNEAVVSMSARMQIATRTAGSNDEGANNFKNFLTKLTSQDTIKDFKKQGIDLIPSLQAAARQGMDPIAAGVELVMQHVATKAPEAAAELKKVAAEVAAIKDPTDRAAELARRQGMIQKLGDRAGIGDLFQDMQAVSYLLAELQSKGDLSKMMEEVRGGKNADGQSVLDADFARRTEGMAEKMKSLKIAFTDLGIAFGNALAPVADTLVPVIRGMASLLTRFTEAHPALSRMAAVSLTGVSALAVLGFAARWVAGGFMSSIGSMVSFSGALLRTRYGVMATSATLSFFGRAAGTMRAALPVLLTGLRSVGLAFLGIPGIGWIAAAVAALAFVVWKYWQPIKAFVAGMWDGLKAGLAPAMAVLRPAFDGLWSAFKRLMNALQPLGAVLRVALAPFLFLLRPVIGLLGSVWRGIVSLFKPVQDTGNAARNMGQAFGMAIARALGGMADMVAKFAALPTRFMQIGANIVEGLIAGVKGKWADAVNAVSGLAHEMKDKFKALLGIKSPSRVFMGFGNNIGEGAQAGILGSVNAVKGAVSKLAGVALAGAAVMPAAAGAGGYASVVERMNSARPNAAPMAQAAGYTVSFAPTINMRGGSDARAQVNEALGMSMRELETMLRRLTEERARRAF